MCKIRVAEPRKRSDVLGKKMMMKEDDEEGKKPNETKTRI